MKHLNLALATVLLLFGTISVAHDHSKEGAHGDMAGFITVDSVVPDSPAAAAGVQVGDILALLDGQKLQNQDDLMKVLGAHEPGDTVPLVVERGGETVELKLTFGERPGGGVSVGLSMAISAMQGAGGLEGEQVNCLEWVEQTYRIETMMRDLNLDLSEAYEASRACVGPQRSIERYCDNIFKVHCAGLDLVTEIGEAQVQRCEEQLSDSLGLSPGQYQGWKACGQHKVFDRYSMTGESSDQDSCKTALLEECGTSLDAKIQADALSPEQQAFVECCSADGVGPQSESDCGMIDDGFERGPCHDRPVCVNRLTSEWLSCSAPG